MELTKEFKPTAIRQAGVEQQQVGLLLVGKGNTSFYASGTAGVPHLKDVPGLGYLFGSKTKADQMEELLIFITPYILEEHKQAAASPPNNGISVIGNRELPQALVIVPWQPPKPGEFDGKPLQSLIDEVLGPIDKDVHKRKVSYYEQYR